MRGREALIERIRHIRRTAEVASPPTKPVSTDPEQDHVRALEARVDVARRRVGVVVLDGHAPAQVGRGAAGEHALRGHVEVDVKFAVDAKHSQEVL